MADADPLLDPYLEEEDKDLIGSLETAEPAIGAPVPDDLEEIAPATEVATPPPAIDAPLVLGDAPATPPDQAGSIMGRTKEAEGLVNRQAELDAERAKVNAGTATRIAEDARAADEDARLERADYLERRQQAEQDLQRRVKALDEAKVTGPRRNTFKSKLAVIFGGLGAAFRSAGGGDSKNTALVQQQQQWENETELQKANIAALRDSAIQARTRLADVDQGRRNMMRDADARLIGRYNAALRQGEAQLKNQGVPQAALDADRRILTLREGRDAALARVRKAEDEHALNQARINRLNAQAAREKAKAKGKSGGGGGGGASTFEREQAVARHLIANPGDIPGAMQVAGPGFDSKRFDKIVAQTKGTESQNKSAEQGRAGIRAVEALEKSTYVPTEADTARWLQNQAEVYAAATPQGGGALGVINAKVAGGMRSLGLAAKSEVEGLSPEGQKYFADVRRLMEPLGRAKSGAAISANEWTNFFNQYGPQSAGGFAAARKELEDLLKLSGVAGRTLGAGGAQPVPAKAAPSDAEKLADAKRVIANPGDYSPAARKGAAAYLKSRAAN